MYIDPFGLETTVVVTTDYGIGSHSSVHVHTGSETVLYDPNGNYLPPSGIPPGSGEVHNGSNADLQDYIKWHQKSGSTVDTYPLNLTPEQENQLIENIMKQPASPPFGCAISTSSAFDGMCGIEPTWFPGKLADQVKGVDCR